MKHHHRKWLAAGLCLTGFLLLALNLQHLAPLDAPVYRVLSDMASPFWNRFFLLFTNLASPLVLLIITLIVVATLPRRELRIPALMNLCVSVMLNLGLKHVFARPRPTDVVHIVVESGTSFPSGHTMAAACFYGFLIWLVWELCTSKALRNTLTVVLGAVIMLVAISRVYLGAHYFSDVLGGLCISVVYLTVFTTIVSRFFEHGESLLPKGAEPNAHNRLQFSFLYAFEGILAGLKQERNMVIHFAAMATVVVFGALLGLNVTEWCLCIILFGAVIAAELLNTAVEAVVDLVSPESHALAKLAKDTAAGAVLVIAIAAAIVGAIIFGPKLLALLAEQL